MANVTLVESEDDGPFKVGDLVENNSLGVCLVVNVYQSSDSELLMYVVDLSTSLLHTQYSTRTFTKYSGEVRLTNG